MVRALKSFSRVKKVQCFDTLTMVINTSVRMLIDF